MERRRISKPEDDHKIKYYIPKEFGIKHYIPKEFGEGGIVDVFSDQTVFDPREIDVPQLDEMLALIERGEITPPDSLKEMR